MSEDIDPKIVSKDFLDLFKCLHIVKSEKCLKLKASKRNSKSKNVPAATPSELLVEGNPSYFSVYSAVRSVILEHNFAEAFRCQMNDAGSSESEGDAQVNDSTHIPLPKVVAIGIEAVFEIIKECHTKQPETCIKALDALHKLLEGQSPQSFRKENLAVLDTMFATLLKLSKCETPSGPSSSKSNIDSTHLTALATSSLISLAIARGDTKQILQTVFSLLNCEDDFIFQKIDYSQILRSLQQSILSILVGKTNLPEWSTHGILERSLVDQFSIQFKTDDDLKNIPQSMHGIATDGTHLYIIFSTGIYKVGTGAFGTIKGYVYHSNTSLPNQKYCKWLGWANNMLYCYTIIGRRSQMQLVDCETLEVDSYVIYDVDKRVKDQIDSSSYFSDGHNIGYICPSNDDGFLVRTISNDYFDYRNYKNEFNVRLVTKSLFVSGPATWDSQTCLRTLVTGFDEEVAEIYAGKDFTIIRTKEGKLLYCGKGSSLGQKSGVFKQGKWLELNLPKNPKFIQCAVGHEGIHSLLLAEDGKAFFVGTPKRGEDGDLGKGRRVVKASKPKRVTRLETHVLVSLASNNGSSAFVSSTGELFLYGKDASPSLVLPSGKVRELDGVRVERVAAGKAHFLLLTQEGRVYSMGLSNKGQCGRGTPGQHNPHEAYDDEEGDEDESGPSGAMPQSGNERKSEGGNICPPGTHRLLKAQCLICTLCLECSGYGKKCISAIRPNRNPGQECGCGVGDAGCAECGVCKSCLEKLEHPDAHDIPEEVDYGVDNEFPIMRVPYHRLPHYNMDPLDLFEDKNLDNPLDFEKAHEVPLLVEEEKEFEIQSAHRHKIIKEDISCSTSKFSRELTIPYEAPARINLPNYFIQAACGLFHSVLLDNKGKVFVFGYNNYGQLGLGDTVTRLTPIKVVFPKDVEIVKIAAGSYHTVCLDSDGVVYTAGSNSKSQLGRSCPEDDMLESCWEKLMLPISFPEHLGNVRATWIGASGDSTFIKIESSLISPKLLSKSFICANKSTILIFTPPESSLGPSTLVINRRNGSCSQNSTESRNSLTNHHKNNVVIDPLYNFLYSYDEDLALVKCYNEIGSSVRYSGSESSGYNLLKFPSALPLPKNMTIYRWQAGANLLACVETLFSARSQGLYVSESHDFLPSSWNYKSFTNEEFNAATRFENHGGGWGYSSNSSEAIRFMCDSDVLIGGYGLYGGRGVNIASIKLIDIGVNGGEIEVDGEIIAQADEIEYECRPKQKYRAVFDEPVPIVGGRWYVAMVTISGSTSDCGAGGLEQVVTENNLTFHFKSSKRSTNGTDVSSGQIPQILYRALIPEKSKTDDECDTKESQGIHILSSDFMSTFTPESIDILNSIFEWCNSQLLRIIPDIHHNVHKQFIFNILEFIACLTLRLMEYSTKDANSSKTSSGKVQTESISMSNSITNVRTTVQNFVTLDISHNDLKCADFNEIMTQACVTFISCFKTFYPTPQLKWEVFKRVTHLATNPTEGYVRLLMCIVWALWGCRGQLMSIFPILKNIPLLSDESNVVFISTSELSWFKCCQNKELDLKSRLSVDGEGLTAGHSNWDFWETLHNFLKILHGAESSSTDLHNDILINSAILIERLMEELVSYASGTFNQLVSFIGQALYVTPSRFSRANLSKTWNTQVGSSDAISFQSSHHVLIYGAVIYTGIGMQTVELELLEDVPEDECLGVSVSGRRWVLLESVSRYFEGGSSEGGCGVDGGGAQILFSRGVHVSPGSKYALRVQNSGGRSSNGDGGSSSVECPEDGVIFTFSPCPLSTNGTNQIRGQFPSLLYYKYPDNLDTLKKSKTITEMDARKCGLKFCRIIFEDAKLRFRDSENLSISEIEKLNNSSYVKVLLPGVIARLEKLASADPRNCVELLELIRGILPDVSKLNNKMNSIHRSESKKLEYGVHSVWVESSHPYISSSLSQQIVKFPGAVRYVGVEFDPRCITAQDDDVLNIYIQYSNENSQLNENLPSLVPATEKCYGVNHWPQKAVILPGNELIFSLETSADYAKGEEKDYFGYRALVTGYEFIAEPGLQQLELELSNLGGFCAQRLIMKNLELPSVSVEELATEESSFNYEENGSQIAMRHHSIFSRGIDLEYFPSVQEALDGIVPLRENSKEKEFISDFVSRKHGSIGELLANFLQPESFVDPEKCDIFVPTGKVSKGIPTTVIFVTKDQNGHFVMPQNLKVEIYARLQKSNYNINIPCSAPRASSTRVTKFGKFRSVPETCYQPTIKDKMKYHAITMMKEYEDFSFEELRYLSPPSQTFRESMLVKQNSNGTFTATWTPSFSGTYGVFITVDGYNLSKSYEVSVGDSDSTSSTHLPLSLPFSPPPIPLHSRLRKLCLRPSESAGLRIRAQPSLLSEEIGILPLGAVVTLESELQNEDGIWIRLDEECLKVHRRRRSSNGLQTEGWCLQFNQQLCKALLLPLSPPERPGGRRREGRGRGAELVVSNENSSKVLRINTAGGECTSIFYIVEECGASGHNIRARPSLRSPPIGILNRGELVRVTEEVENSEGLWLKLDNESVNDYCFTKSGDGWTLAIGVGNVVYLKKEDTTKEVSQGYDFSEACRAPTAFQVLYNSSPPLSFASFSQQDPKSLSPEPKQIEEVKKESLDVELSSQIEERKPKSKSRSATTFGALQKWIQLSTESFGSSTSSNSNKQSQSMIEVSKSFVKDGIHALSSSSKSSSLVTSSTQTSPPLPPTRIQFSIGSSDGGGSGGLGGILKAKNEEKRKSKGGGGRGGGGGTPRPHLTRLHSPSPTQLNENSQPIQASDFSTPVNEAINPSEAHSIRAVFGAVLWYNGIIQDALASASHLKLNEKYKSKGLDSPISPPPNYKRKTSLTRTSPQTHRQEFKLNSPERLLKIAQKEPDDKFEKTSESSEPPLAITAFQKIFKHVRMSCNEAIITELFRGLRMKSDVSGVMRSKKDKKISKSGSNTCSKLAKKERSKDAEIGPSSSKNSEGSENFSDMSQCDVCHVRFARKGKSKKLYFGLSSLCQGCIERNLRERESVPLPLLTTSSCNVEICTPPQASLYTTLLSNALFLLEILGGGGGRSSSELDSDGSSSVSISPILPNIHTSLSTSFLCYGGLGVEEERRGDSKSGSDTEQGVENQQPQFRAQKREKRSSDEQTSDEGADVSSLVHEPSVRMQKFLKDGVFQNEKNALDVLCKDVLSFVTEQLELNELKLYIFQTIRRATCKSYGMKMLTWLLKNVSQPTGLHDIFWRYANCMSPVKYPDELDSSMEDFDNGWWLIRKHPLDDIPISLFPDLSDAFYLLHQTISDLIKILPIGNPLLEMAVKCWGIEFSSKDHKFLHKCKIFRNLSKIMSQFDGDAEWSRSSLSVEGGENESVCQFEFRYSLQDLSTSAQIKVSSRSPLAPSLTDGTTETFWESGDDDRNRNIIIYASAQDEVRVIAIFIDNQKDQLYKVTAVTPQILSGTSSKYLSPEINVDVSSKFVGWLWFQIKEKGASAFRFDLKGSNGSVRVRQVKILGVKSSGYEISSSLTTSLIVRQKCENETLRIFKLLSHCIFGSFLKSLAEGEDDEGNNLQEHLVGILFRRKKLTNLQKQVCTHIVAAIHRESIKIKEEFDSRLSGSLLEVSENEAKLVVNDKSKVGDRYCFEMLSLVLALSDSKVGRIYLACQVNLIQDLCQFLHTGTPRIQRQVISILRKIFMEISPGDFSHIISSLSRNEEEDEEGGILNFLLGVIAKGLEVKVRENSYLGRTKAPKLININQSLLPETLTHSYWYLQGDSESTLCPHVVNLIKDMTQGHFSLDWQNVSRKAISDAILFIPSIPSKNHTVDDCFTSPRFWLSLAALCVLHQEHCDQLSYPTLKNGISNRPTCSNHDDGETLAVFQCSICGDLCAECDKVLHLPKKSWDHLRKVCKEEEEAIKVDLHEGCGRIKLFWLMALADSTTLKALVEFRDGIPKAVERDSSTGLYSVGRCRFCNSTGNIGALALGNVCADSECQEFYKTACEKVLSCNHLCGGVKNETICLPCLQHCSISCEGAENLKQDGEDMCMICFTDALSYAPSIQLACGHVFHYHCCRKVLEAKWAGPRITFSFSTCPMCKVSIKHELLKELLDPVSQLYEDVKRKSIMRLEYEGMSQIDAISSPGGHYFRKPEQYAMDRYAYYLCFKCNKAYFGGDARCDAETQVVFDPRELVCGACSDVTQAQICPKHGTDYLEYKCRYCCSVAVFFCFGTTHFCNGCHEDFQRLTNISKQQLPNCPVGPRAIQMDSEECPLHTPHPPTGEEFALGCGFCRNAHSF